MITYVPPIEDMTFLLGQVLDFDGRIASLPGWEEINTEFAGEILREAGRFCADVLTPLNLPGDKEGATLTDGEVSTPAGFAQAYSDFVAGGWAGLSGPCEYGGQGLPRVLQILLDEMVSSANLSFGLFPGLTRGAAEALATHGSEELKAAWLPGLISGDVCGTMALTESSAGTDLGLLRTRADPAGDGTYRVTGTKIFISSGDHDFGNNIAHLVLARLPDAPAGVKGLSLFLVPKLIPGEDNSPVKRNSLSVGSLEHKMGIHAQPTCVMNYDGAVGWLVGEPGRGLSAMFTMMNSERLFVGIQGLGVAEAAQQNAASYARERLQGRSADGARGPVPIIEHADVRKMLLQGRAFIGGARALAIWTAMQMDIAERHPDAAAQAHAAGMVALLTPVVKAAFTDMGFETAVTSQQVLGGHGYIHEWGMEQFVRDARITQIYEGTNGIQAMDLVARKLPLENGRLVRNYFELISGDLDRASRSAATAAPIADAVAKALARLESVTRHLVAVEKNADLVGTAATDYLRLFALVSLGWTWALMVEAVDGHQDTLARRKRHVGLFFAERMLPQAHSLAAAIEAGAGSIMGIDAELF
jgi:alkylation response protein AidB-like acyl-CoA dehydrogenase